MDDAQKEFIARALGEYKRPEWIAEQFKTVFNEEISPVTIGDFNYDPDFKDAIAAYRKAYNDNYTASPGFSRRYVADALIAAMDQAASKDDPRTVAYIADKLAGITGIKQREALEITHSLPTQAPDPARTLDAAQKPFAVIPLQPDPKMLTDNQNTLDQVLANRNRALETPSPESDWVIIAINYMDFIAPDPWIPVSAKPPPPWVFAFTK